MIEANCMQPPLLPSLQEKFVQLQHITIHYPYNEDSLGGYLETIGQVPLLDKEEERGLATRIEIGKHAGSALLQETTPSPDSETISALNHSRSEGQRAQDLLTMSNLRLVVYFAKRYRSVQHLEPLDLIQEGNIGLVRAVKNFNYRYGTFVAFASKHIVGELNRCAREQDLTISLPRRQLAAVKALDTKEMELVQQLGRHPQASELAAALATTPENIAQLQVWRQNTHIASFEAPIADDNPATYGDFVADNNDSQGIDPLQKIEDAMALKPLLSRLNDQQEQVISLRYGLADGVPRTQQQSSKIIGISRARTGFVENEALAGMRQAASYQAAICRYNPA